MTLRLNFILILLSSVLSVQAQQWHLTNHLYASDGKYDDGLGSGVDIFENYALVSAKYRDTKGVAYIYKRDSAKNWIELQQIQASDNDIDNFFGSSLSLNGKYAVIGVSYPNHSQVERDNVGKAYVFERNGDDQFTEVQILRPPLLEKSTDYGEEVKVFDDNIYVGAPSEWWLDSNMKQTASGAVYHYTKSGNSWLLSERIYPSDFDSIYQFGYSIAVNDSFLVIGCPGSHQEGNTSAGAVLVYKKSSQNSWEVFDTLVSTAPQDYEWFGSSVSITDSFLVVGSPNKGGSFFLLGPGSVSIFKLNGKWEHHQTISKEVSSPRYYFGHEISMSNKFLVVCEYNSFASGTVYIYSRNSSNVWVLNQILEGGIISDSDYFGQSASIYNKSLLVGVPGLNRGGSMNMPKGQARIFTYCNKTYSEQTIESCKNFRSPSGKFIWSTSGTYIDTVNNTMGCDSVITIHLQIVPSHLSRGIKQTGESLEAIELDASYQWLKCSDSMVRINNIPQERSFSPLEWGNYLVIIEKDGCIDTSECYNFAGGIQYSDSEIPLMVFPNPGENLIRIQIGNYFEEIECRLVNSLGQVVQSVDMGGKQSIDIQSDLESGMYYIQVLTGTGLKATVKYFQL